MDEVVSNIPYRLAGAEGKIYSKLFTRRCYANTFVSGDNKNYKPTLLQHPCQNNQNLSRTFDLPGGWFVIGEIYHLHSRRNTILCTYHEIHLLSIHDRITYVMTLLLVLLEADHLTHYLFSVPVVMPFLFPRLILRVLTLKLCIFCMFSVEQRNSVVPILPSKI